MFRMERSAEERTKYPDRINLDRRGLHGIPLLADEPGLRLLRFPLSFLLSLTKTKTKAKTKTEKETKTHTKPEKETKTKVKV